MLDGLGRAFAPKRAVLALAAAGALLLSLSSSAAAGTLATESGDWAYPNAPTFTAGLGSQTVTGTLGPTPTDGQDPFNVDIPSTLEVTSVSYSGPAGPHNLVGCGLTGVGNLNQTFSSNNSGCLLSWFINTDFAVAASPWTVTIVTQLKPVEVDTQPPSWSVANVTATTDSPSGVAVSYSATASDNVGVTSSSCSPASGTVFPVGTTTVNCIAFDAAGNFGGASFTVTVELVDTTPPTVTVPDDITVEATGPSGAIGRYSAVAFDAGGLATFVCTPASGSVFPLGTTTVTCTATDTSGNQTSESFDITVVDTTAPTLTVPDDITAEATGPSGADVTFTPSADDAVGIASLDCTPASGSTFPLGTTTVTCTATDTSGNQTSDTFDITVVDTTAPTLTVPDDITAEASAVDGAAVDYTATATDAVGIASLDCTPPSGSTFPLGTTTVTCTATDTSGNQTSDTFDITVTVDATSVGVIIDSIEAQGLGNGVERSLLGPLSQVERLAGDNNPNNDRAACNKLDSFVGHVAKRVADGPIDASYGDELTAFAMAIKSSIGC